MKKILIVDDSPFMRNILKDLLTNQNNQPNLAEDVKVFEADGKTNALNQVKKVKPDAILLDVVMKESETEGLEFLQEIVIFYDVSKVIMISSVGQDNIIEECKRLGVNVYLQKPFEHSEVINVVNSIIK